MRTVLVVGAGGTLANAQSFRPRRTGQHPPLDHNFFDRAATLSKSDSTVAGRISSLKAALASSTMFEDPWVPPKPALEQFFADIYYEVAGRSHDAFAVFVELIHLYSVVIASTTNWMACRPRVGVIGSLLRAELDKLDGDQLTIITFNQDLLIENELECLSKRYGAVNLHELYGNIGLIPLSADYIPEERKFDLSTRSRPGRMPVRLFKLHGSLNWTLRTTARNPQLGTLFPSPQQAQSRRVYIVGGREVRDDISMRSQSRSGRTNWYLWPLVVPPIYDKQRVTAMNTLTRAWDQARVSLEQADRIILLGYSMPEADILARQLLRRAFIRNSRLTSLECINPDVSLVTKLKHALAPEVIRIFESVSAYLTA
jgi:hypothetical protein